MEQTLDLNGLPYVECEVIDVATGDELCYYYLDSNLPNRDESFTASGDQTEIRFYYPTWDASVGPYDFYVDDFSLERMSTGDVAYYDADVLSTKDYYAFGQTMPGRIYTNTTSS